MEVELLSRSLGVVRELVGREGRDTALAMEATKAGHIGFLADFLWTWIYFAWQVLLSKCQGRGLSRARVRVIAALLPLLKEEDEEEHGLQK